MPKIITYVQPPPNPTYIVYLLAALQGRFKSEQWPRFLNYFLPALLSVIYGLNGAIRWFTRVIFSWYVILLILIKKFALTYFLSVLWILLDRRHFGESESRSVSASMACYRYLKKKTWKTSVVDRDPHWFGCPGSGSILEMRIRVQEHGKWPKLTNKPGLLPFKEAFYSRRYRMFFYLFKYIFLIKRQLLNQCGSATLEKTVKQLLNAWTVAKINE